MSNLITLEEYKNAKGIKSSELDLQINTLIPMVSDLIKDYCSNDFTRDTYDEQQEGLIDQRGFYMFFFKNTPIVTLNSIKLKFYGVDQEVDIDVTKVDINKNAGYATYAGALDLSNGIVIRSEYKNNFYSLLNYIGGPASVPEGVKMATITALSEVMLSFYGEQVASGSSTYVGEKKKLKIGDYTIDLAVMSDKLKNNNNKGLLLSDNVKLMLTPYKNSSQSI